MHDLPRSALLAAWGTAVLDGRVSLPHALSILHQDDEPHEVRLPAGGARPPFDEPGEGAGLTDLDGVTDLDQLLRRVSEAGAQALRVVLPVPGDPRGLPGPDDLNKDAVDAGECALVVADRPLALVPQVRAFGSAHEPGHQVAWTVHLAGVPSFTDLDDLPTVEARLRRTLTETTDALAGLDVARWRPSAADTLRSVRDGAGPARSLPPGSSPRAARVLDLACRVRLIVTLAVEDDSGALSLWEGTRRAQALRDLDDVGRQAVAAAVNACAPPGGPPVATGRPVHGHRATDA